MHLWLCSALSQSTASAQIFIAMLMYKQVRDASYLGMQLAKLDQLSGQCSSWHRLLPAQALAEGV